MTIRHFVPQNLDLSDPAQLVPLYDQLIARPIGSVAELEKWLADASELSAAVDEYGSRRYIDKSCHTDDPAIEKAYLHFVENVEPRIKPLFFAMQKKFLASPHRTELTGQRFDILARKWQADVDIFRDENVPLETQATQLVTEYDKTAAAMTVQFRGKEYTPQQMARFFEEPDRPTRQAAWEATASRRLIDREKIDGLFDKVLPLRQQIAANAGLANHRDYVWKAYKRFDYTPQDCLKFDEAIARTCVPLVGELDRQRKVDLKIDAIRPWDLSVDPQNRPPLRPFAEDQIEQFVEKTHKVFGRLSPQLAEDFSELRKHANLDLASRKGKQPGGYQCALEESLQPFIFMNAAGVQRDVETLLHEGGHAFHYQAAKSEPLVFLRHAPMEFCEVASMSMELLGSDHLAAFYDEADAARAKRSLLEGIIRFLPWMATIDYFQHWLYTNPGHSRDARTEQWVGIYRHYFPTVDWSGYDGPLQSMWQKQMHLFHAPFYYIEYGIAQLGALQIWSKSRRDPAKALANYRNGLKYGGTRPLPELFAAAGIEFDFSERTLRPLMDAVGEELARLPR